MLTKQNRRAGNTAAAGVENAGANSKTHHTAADPEAQASTPIYAAGKVVGHVYGNTFYKRVRASVHLLRQHPGPGWAYGMEVLAAAELAGARRLQIHDTEANVTYTATLETLKAHGVDFERNAGPQVCLPLKWWTTNTTPPQFNPPTVTEATPKRTRRAAKFTPPPLSGTDFTGAQLDLFADSARAVDSVLENVNLQPNGKRRAALGRRAQKMTRKLAREICEVASADGGQ